MNYVDFTKTWTVWPSLVEYVDFTNTLTIWNSLKKYNHFNIHGKT